MVTDAQPSKKSIDRAATLLRDWVSDGSNFAEWTRAHAQAVDLVWDYRKSFRYPLTKINVGLRQFVGRESAEVVVSSRLKRLPTILDKLARLPNMKITRMQDIGGCRAVLAAPPEEQGVMKRIKKNWDGVEGYDTEANPRPRPGY